MAEFTFASPTLLYPIVLLILIFSLINQQFNFFPSSDQSLNHDNHTHISQQNPQPSLSYFGIPTQNAYKNIGRVSNSKPHLIIA